MTNQKDTLPDNFFRSFVMSMGTYASYGAVGSVKKMVELAADWSRAHRVGNGQLSDEEQDEIVKRLEDRLRDWANLLKEEKTTTEKTNADRIFVGINEGYRMWRVAGEGYDLPMDGEVEYVRFDVVQAMLLKQYEG